MSRVGSAPPAWEPLVHRYEGPRAGPLRGCCCRAVQTITSGQSQCLRPGPAGRRLRRARHPRCSRGCRTGPGHSGLGVPRGPVMPRFCRTCARLQPPLETLGCSYLLASCHGNWCLRESQEAASDRHCILSAQPGPLGRRRTAVDEGDTPASPSSLTAQVPPCSSLRCPS